MADSKFPARLREKRKARGYTQAQLAEAAGVSVQAVSQWETGQSGASHDRIVMLGSILGVDWGWLGYGEETENPDRAPTASIDETGDYLRGPLLNRSEIATWIKKYPDLEVDPYDALGFEDQVESGIQREWFEPRYAPTGIIFASGIYTTSMVPDFSVGDVILFDTALNPSPGDYILIYNGKTERVIFRKLVLKSSDDGSILVFGAPHNADFPLFRIAEANDSRIIATMAEHRRYRRRGAATLGQLSHVLSKRKSRDA